jgi:hypothetical protein
MQLSWLCIAIAREEGCSVALFRSRTSLLSDLCACCSLLEASLCFRSWRVGMSSAVRSLLLTVAAVFVACLLAPCSAQSGVNTTFYLDMNCTSKCDTCTVSNPIITAGGCVRERYDVNSSSITTACNSTHVIGALSTQHAQMLSHNTRRQSSPNVFLIGATAGLSLSPAPPLQAQPTAQQTAVSVIHTFPSLMKWVFAVPSRQATPHFLPRSTHELCVPLSPHFHLSPPNLYSWVRKR